MQLQDTYACERKTMLSACLRHFYCTDFLTHNGSAIEQIWGLASYCLQRYIYTQFLSTCVSTINSSNKFIALISMPNAFLPFKLMQKILFYFQSIQYDNTFFNSNLLSNNKQTIE